MIKKPYPPDLIRDMLRLWHAYKIRLSHAPETADNVFINYIFINKATGGIKFTHYLN